MNENVIDNISPDTIEVVDQIYIDGDPIEVKAVRETDDIDEIVIVGYSHDTGDTETYSLFADDYFDVWAV